MKKSPKMTKTKKGSTKSREALKAGSITSGKLAVVRIVNVDRKDCPRLPKYADSSQSSVAGLLWTLQN